MATDTIDETQVASYFAGLDAKLNAMVFKEPLGRIAAEAEGGMAEFILKSTAPDGTPYAPLKWPRPKGHNPNPRPLIDFGPLIQSLISGTDHYEDIEDFYASVGPSHWKAVFHEEGTKRIPARPFIGINEQTQERAPELIGDFIMKQFE